VDDSKFTGSNKYGMIHPDINIAENIRAVFIIDPKNKIRSINFYPMEIGRNLDEIKRSIIALQTVDKHKNIATPANWKPGDDVLVPVITQEQKKNIGTPDSQFEQVAWFMTFKKL
jgi:peroxiredoxin (alkyl hydroperoxide reductase subunit C)